MSEAREITPVTFTSRSTGRDFRPVVRNADAPEPETEDDGLPKAGNDSAPEPAPLPESEKTTEPTLSMPFALTPANLEKSLETAKSPDAS